MPNAPSFRDTALCAQAHWFIYATSNPSLESFRDDYFKMMLMSMIPPDKAPQKKLILTIPKLKLVVEAEFACFVCFLRNMLQKTLEESHGNRCCQFIHDGCTLDNKLKYQAFGLQFTHEKYQTNHVVALTFERVLSSTSENVGRLTEQVVKEITGVDFGDLCRCSVQDAAAKSVARYL